MKLHFLLSTNSASETRTQLPGFREFYENGPLGEVLKNALVVCDYNSLVKIIGAGLKDSCREIAIVGPGGHLGLVGNRFWSKTFWGGINKLSESQQDDEPIIIIGEKALYDEMESVLKFAELGSIHSITAETTIHKCVH